MALQTGTLQVSDTLVQRLRTEICADVLDQNVLAVGLDRLQAAVQAEVDAHNELVRDMVTALAVRTTLTTSSYGGQVGGEMIETDEYARVPTQKGFVPSKINFPLRQFQFAVGWTYMYYRVATVRDMLVRLGGAQVAHREKILQQVSRALFGAANYTFRDYTVDNAELSVKRLVNADGAAIPMGLNASAFDPATHTHYDALDYAGATEAQRETAVNGLVYDVVEHGHAAGNVLYCAMGDEKKVRGLPSFEPYLPASVIRGTAEDRANGVLQTTNPTNRAIGVMTESGAEVWVKPWIPKNYLFTYAADDPRKPLAERVPEGRGGLETVAQNAAYPLYADYMMAEFGFGANERTNGAVLYLGGAVYTEPTF